MSIIPGNTSTTATIATGQVRKDALTTAGDSDWYRATFSAGLSYGFRLSGDGSGSSLPDPDLFLYDANGTKIAGTTNYSYSSTSLSYHASTGGTFYVGVTDTMDLGNYVLTWIGNDTIRRDIATTATLSQGGSVNSAIDVSGDSDWFKVTMKAGLDYGFLVSGDGTTASLPDPDIHLRDANGNKIVSNTNYSYLVRCQPSGHLFRRDHRHVRDRKLQAELAWKRYDPAQHGYHRSSRARQDNRQQY
jgi:serralysin